MPDERAYDYWLIRYVPDTIRGEHVNIGVLVGGDDDWALRRVTSFARASLLGGNASLTQPWLTHLAGALATHNALTRAKCGQFTPAGIELIRTQMNNTIQLSARMPVLGTSAASAADLLFELLVAEPAAHA
jgi:hypothetical protein